MDAGGWVGWGVGLSVAVLDGAGVIVGDGDCPQANADNRTTAAQIDNFVGWAMFHLVEVMNGDLATTSIDHLILPGNNLPNSKLPNMKANGVSTTPEVLTAVSGN